VSAELAGKDDWEILSENSELGEAVDPKLITQNSELKTSLRNRS